MLEYTALPVLFAANAAVWGAAIFTGANLEVAFFASFLGSLGYLAVLEVVAPHRRDWAPTPKEWLRDLGYFSVNGVLDAITKAGIGVIAIMLATGSNGLPLWLDVALALLLADFAGYWVHRFGHHGWLWKVHGVHHTPDKVNLVNNNTAHFVNIVLSATAKLAPALVLGASSEAILVAAGISSLQSFVVHVNAQVTLPAPLDRILMTPEHHRLHHSTVLEQAGNFASVLTVWDAMFGTLVHEPGLQPTEVGIFDPGTFPAPNDVVRNVLHPFVADRRYDTAGRLDVCPKRPTSPASAPQA